VVQCEAHAPTATNKSRDGSAQDTHTSETRKGARESQPADVEASSRWRAGRRSGLPRRQVQQGQE
jgi:hypothetical protein